MINDVLPPTQAEECRNLAEILRELAVQLHFDHTRDRLFSLADNLDRDAVHFDREIWAAVCLTQPEGV